MTVFWLLKKKKYPRVILVHKALYEFTGPSAWIPASVPSSLALLQPEQKKKKKKKKIQLEVEFD